MKDVKHVAPGDPTCKHCGAHKQYHFGAKLQCPVDDGIYSFKDVFTEPETYIEEQDMCKREDGMVTFSFKDPDYLIHMKSERCPIECPHHIDECGEFDRCSPTQTYMEEQDMCAREVLAFNAGIDAALNVVA